MDKTATKYLNDLLIPVYKDFVDITILEKSLTSLGIHEDFPQPTKQLDFANLEGSAIRKFNKIIKYMKENDMTEVSDLIQKNNIDMFTVVSKTKEHIIQTISAEKFKDILKSKNILEAGEELDENFVEFVQVSKEHDDIIMVSKLQKAVAKIRNHRYFSYFGEEMRTYSGLEHMRYLKKKTLMRSQRFHSDKKLPKPIDLDEELLPKYENEEKYNKDMEKKIRVNKRPTSS